MARTARKRQASRMPIMIAKDNPDLPMAFIEDVLAAQEESTAGLGTAYRWGVIGK